MNRKLLYPALSVLLPLLVYLPTIKGGFYYDDNVVFFGHQARHLVENPFLVFTEGSHALPGTPRSLHVFMLLLIFKIFGPSPVVFHLVNLIFHSLTTLIVFMFLRALTGQDALSLFASLIFGLHPSHIENITFVTLGGTDLFYGFFSFLSLYLYLIFRLKKGGYFALSLSVLSYISALLSKESALSFIFVYPLLELFLRKRGFLWALPHLIALLIIKWGFLGGGVSMLRESGRATISPIVLSLGYFIKTLIFPYPLSPIIKEFPNQYMLYGFIGLFLISAVVFAYKRVGLGLFGLGVFVFSSLSYLFVPYIGTNVAITADRYLYVPTLGLAIVGGALWAGIKNRFRPYMAGALLFSYGAIGIFYFYSAWRTEEAFWRYSAKMNPDEVSSYISLASIELQKGNTEDAMRLLLEGLSKPKGMPAEYAQAAHIVGSIEAQRGRLREAESYWLLALRHSPYEFAFIDLGMLYLNTGRIEQARWAFENALLFPQKNPRAMLGLAKSLELLGEKDKAIEYALRVYNEARDDALRIEASEILRRLKR